MFILIKLGLIIFAFLYRLINKPILYFSKKMTVEGIEFSVVHSKHHSSLLIPLKSRFIFKLNPEKIWDKFLKSLGLAKEFQTGNKEFDDRIYLASDSLTLNKHLAEDSDFINLVLELSKIGFDQIVVDGNYFRLKFSKDKIYDTNFLSKAVKIFQSLEAIEKKWYGRFSDAFAAKYILAEAVLWSIAGYGISCFLEMFNGVSVYYDLWSLLKQGLIYGGVAALLSIIIIFYQFRGSSRGHRIIIECILIILLGIPASGVGLLSDLNTKLDHKQTMKIELLIEDKRITVSRNRRTTTTHYKLELAQKNNYRFYQLPSTLEVESDLYERANVGDFLIVEVAPGRFNYPWYKKMTVSPTSSLANSKR